MKKVRILLISAIFTLLAVSGYAQNSLAGASKECLLNLQFYEEWLKQDNLVEATPVWREAFRLCPPGIRQKLYQDGQRVFNYLIEKNKDNPELKEKLIDSLFMMFDLRIKYFPNYAARAAEYKVYEVDKYKSNDDALVLSVIYDAINLGGASTEPGLLVMAMQRVSKMFSESKVVADKVMETYAMLEDIVDAQIAANNSTAERAKKDIDNLFATSGVASCENIVTLFTPRFEADPDDKALVSTIVKLLSDANCTNEVLFLKAVNALHKLEPSYTSAYYLYRLYAANNDHENAIKMLIEAIDSEGSTDVADANYLIELADYYMRKMENLTKAAEAARQALQKSPTVAGRANLILGLIWGSLKCTGNEIEIRAKYWVAVDYLIKARNAEPSLADEANRYISSYSQYFPPQEEAFMFDVIDGASYTVNCAGMTATTIVRTRK